MKQFRISRFALVMAIGAILILAFACTAPAAQPTSAPPTAASGQATTAPAEATTAPAPGATSMATVPAGAAAQGGDLRVGFSDWPKNLHAQIDSGTEGLYVQVNVTDGLLNIDPEGNIIPGLALDMPEQPDDVTYIFHLRPDVKFHNGDPFTAKDVVWTFDRLLGKIEGQQSTQAARFNQQIASVEAVDDMTVKFTLKQPWIDFLPMMAADKYMDILNERAVTEMGQDYGITGVVGTGPFKFKEWVKGDHITIERNPDYWGAPLPYLNSITYRAIPDQSARLIAIRSGEVDLLFDAPLKDLEALDQEPGITVQTCDSGTEVAFFLNTTKPPFDNKDVRQAIFYGIDREAVMDAAYYGQFAKGQGIFPPWHWAYDPEADFYPYDPEKATELLAGAGYDASNPLSFEIVVGSASEFVDVATAIQAQLSQIGVNVTVTPLEAAAFTAKTFSVQGKANPGFEAAVYRLKFSNLTTDFSWRIYSSKTALNQYGYNQEGGYQHPEVDKLLDESVPMTDREEATVANREINRLITDDALLLNLGWIKISHAYNDKVQGVGCFVRDDWPMREVSIAQ